MLAAYTLPMNLYLCPVSSALSISYSWSLIMILSWCIEQNHLHWDPLGFKVAASWLRIVMFCLAASGSRIRTYANNFLQGVHRCSFVWRWPWMRTYIIQLCTNTQTHYVTWMVRRTLSRDVHHPVWLSSHFPMRYKWYWQFCLSKLLAG
jgi:hypothetical protein